MFVLDSGRFYCFMCFLLFGQLYYNLFSLLFFASLFFVLSVLFFCWFLFFCFVFCSVVVILVFFLWFVVF